jgi:hypothetical protein
LPVEAREQSSRCLHGGLFQLLIAGEFITKGEARIEDKADIVGIAVVLTGGHEVAEVPCPLLETGLPGEPDPRRRRGAVPRAADPGLRHHEADAVEGDCYKIRFRHTDGSPDLHTQYELESIAGTIDKGGDWPLEKLSGTNIAFLQSLDLCAQQLKTLSLLLSDYRELSNEEFEFRFADGKRNLDLFEK